MYFWTMQCSCSSISACYINTCTIDILRQEDAPPLAAGLGLHDEGFRNALALGLLVVLPELQVVEGQQESPREEIIHVWIVLLHAMQILGQIVLPMQRVHAWKMVSLLVLPHFAEHLARDGTVIPLQVPVFAIVVLQFPTHFLTHPLDDLVLGVGDVEHDRSD